MCLKIINQPELLDAGFLGKLGPIDHPWQVGCGDHLIDDWTSNSKTSCIDLCWMISNKQLYDLIQSLMIAAGINLLENQAKSCVSRFEDSDSGVRASNIAGQNHSGIFLQWRPSRPINSSASAGPHDPAP